MQQAGCIDSIYHAIDEAFWVFAKKTRNLHELIKIDFLRGDLSRPGATLRKLLLRRVDAIALACS
ncbi:hypothetical protein PSEUDO8O_150411 [Pseudomonas sp. 8O]|nr:hypothetical protein PSEUDO8O_150411 [Pseudomonas sp. 8O]